MNLKVGSANGRHFNLVNLLIIIVRGPAIPLITNQLFSMFVG